MTFKPGDRIRYKSFAGELYDATIVKVHEAPRFGTTTVDLDIDLPGNQEPFHTTRVPIERCQPVASRPPGGEQDART